MQPVSTPTPVPPAKARSPRRVAGRPAGQREDLVTRLRDLAHSYPAGVGILKEFLQNADDAGATWVRFTLDLRAHRAVDLPDERMAPLLGPAILVESDQVFTDDDLANIQRIGAAGKIDDAGKTGRFGLGFNTVYSITDYPSFATRDLIMTFDAFFDAVALEGEPPGIDWPLHVLWEEGADWPRTFDLPDGVTALGTTTYRLPLRTVEQTGPTRIGRVPVPPEEARKILASLGEASEPLVLFLRSVLAVEARVLHEDGREEMLATLRTTNPDEVCAARDRVLPRPGTSSGALVHALAGQLPAPIEVYEHSFTVSEAGRERSSHWIVCQGMFPGDAGEALDAADAMAEIGEKAVPLGGVALPVEVASGGGWVPRASTGTLCCTLPIPQALGLGLVANARWSLASSRAHIRYGTGGEGEEAVKLDWNEVLARHVVPGALAALVEDLTDRLDAAGARALYALLPDLGRLNSPLDLDLGCGIYRALATTPCIRIRVGADNDWLLPMDAFAVPGEWSPGLVERVIADGLALAEPAVPDHVRRGFANVGAPIDELTPAGCREWLREGGSYEGPLAGASRTCLRSADLVLELLTFCSERGTANLEGLPLALMAEGRLCTFGEGDPIFLADPEARSIFRARPEWFLHADAEGEGPVQPVQADNLHRLGAAEVIENLDTHLARDQDGTWSPGGGAIPDEAWLTELYLWLAALPDLKVHLPALERYGMVPDHKGALIRPGTTATPLLPSEDLSPSQAAALRAFGVPIVHGPKSLRKAVQAFAEAAGGMVFGTTADDVVDCLADEGFSDLPPGSPHRVVLLDWLSAADAAGAVDEDRAEKLRDLAIWPTTDGRIAAATADNAFLPHGFTPPWGFVALTLIQVGAEDRWRALLTRLGTPPLELGEWLQRVFLPGYGSLPTEERRAALVWLRDEGLPALGLMPEEQRGKVRKALRESPLIEGEDGELHAPARLYHPASREAVAVIGATAAFPDMNRVYHRERTAWTTFFENVGLLTRPLDEDVVRRVEQLLSAMTPEQGDATEAGLLAVYDYLEKRWESGEHEGSQLAKALRDLPWIPTMQGPAHDHEVACFVVPPARFVCPADAHPARLLHHAASQVAFVAHGREKLAVRTTLNMPSDVAPAKVLAHFRQVVARWESGGPDAPTPAAVGKAASAFYRVMGQLVGTRGLEAHRMVLMITDSLSESPSVWDESAARFVPASHAFARLPPALAPVRALVTGAAQEGAGLEALGRREEPTPEDYVAVLRELAAQGTGPLSEDHLRAALFCWRQLEEAERLLGPDLPLPTSAGTLAPASSTVVDDAHYWRERLSDANLPWVHPQVSEVAALSAGARRVTEVVHEERTAWTESAAPEVAMLCRDRATHLASNELAMGVLRLVAHAQSDEDPPDLDRVRDAVALRLVACGALEVGLVCPDFGVHEPVGIESAACLLDEDERPPTVWVATDDRESVALELGRALQRRLSEAGLLDDGQPVDSAALEAILRCATHRVAQTLDQRKIRSLVRLATEPLEEQDWDAEGESWAGAQPAAHPTSQGIPEGATDPAEAELDDPSDDDLDTAIEAEVEAALDAELHSGGDDGRRWGRATPTRQLGAARVFQPIDAAPRERQPLTDRAPPPAAPPASTDDGPRPPPTVPHYGQPAKRGRRSGQLLSYVEPAERSERLSAGPSPGRVATEQAALAHVDQVERARGAIVTPMAQQNEGYDREVHVPGEAEARIVEVKGLGAAWDARGVRLTPAELRAAHHYGDRYWVYVVEFAKDPARRRLYRIQGPALQATAYCLDHGWMGLDEPEAEALEPAVGHVLLEGEAVLGVIEEMVERGEARRLQVRSEGGEVRRLNWNPTRHRVQQAEG